MNYEILIFYIFAVVTFIITPGPVVAVVIKNSALSFRSGFFTICGSNFASIILIFVASMIIFQITEISQNLLIFLSFFGSIFIFYLGFSSILKILKNKNEISQIAPQKSKKSFIDGFLTGISNPKDIIFFVAFFPQFIKITNSINLSLFILVFLWIFLDFLLLIIYAIFINHKIISNYKNKIAFFSDFILIIIGIFGIFYFFNSINFI